MKYRVLVADGSFDVVVRSSAEGTTVIVDGREMGVRLEQGAPGTFTLMVDGKPYDLAAAPRAGGYALAIQGVPFDVVVEDERQRRLAAAAPARSTVEGRVVLRAPMPGLVGQVDVVEGDAVEIGQRLLVLEAMKMENDIAAPRAARVKEVMVAKGQVVEQGQPLVVLE